MNKFNSIRITILKGYLLFLMFSCKVNYPTIVDIPETPEGFYADECTTGEICKIEDEIPECYQIMQWSGTKNQWPLGTCVSFATSACGELIYGKSFSEAEFNVLAQTSPLGNQCKDGLFLGEALRVAQHYGLVEENRLPYKTYIKYVLKKNKLQTTDPNWKIALEGKQEESSLSVCSLNSYNTTMYHMRIPLRLQDNEEDDISPYRLPTLQPIHHVPKRAIEENFQRLRSQYKLTLTPFIAATLKNHSRTLPAKSSYSGMQDVKQKNTSTALVSKTSNFTVTDLSSHRDKASYITSSSSDTISAIEKALANNCPVIIAVNVYEGCWEPKASETFKIKMPSIDSKLIGSHAVLLTGYNSKTRLFDVKNSWGNDWGFKGFAFLPYSYVELYASEVIAVENEF